MPVELFRVGLFFLPLAAAFLWGLRAILRTEEPAKLADSPVLYPDPKYPCSVGQCQELRDFERPDLKNESPGSRTCVNGCTARNRMNAEILETLERIPGVRAKERRRSPTDF